MAQAMSNCTAPGARETARADVRGLGKFHVRRRLPLLDLAHWLADQWRRRAVIHQLSRLSDHYLRDIGIERGEIEAVADTMVRRWRSARR